MSTNCRAIVKIGENNYLSMYLDTWQKFWSIACEVEEDDSEGFDDLSKNKKIENLQIAIDWCMNRIAFLKKYPQEVNDVGHPDRDVQYIAWTEDLMKFLRYIRLYYKDQFIEVSIENEHAYLYNNVGRIDGLYVENVGMDPLTITREVEFNRSGDAERNRRKKTPVGGYVQYQGSIESLRRSRWEWIKEGHPDYHNDELRIFVGFPWGSPLIRTMVDIEAKKKVKIIKRIK